VYLSSTIFCLEFSFVLFCLEVVQGLSREGQSVKEYMKQALAEIKSKGKTAWRFGENVWLYFLTVLNCNYLSRVLMTN